MSISLNDEGERLYDDYSQGLLSFASAMCIIFILMGVPGNLITIIALTRCKKVSSFDILLMSVILSISFPIEFKCKEKNTFLLI